MTNLSDKLYQCQRPTRTVDDGRGPYTYCQHGNSYCMDSYCSCTPNILCRVSYLQSRKCRSPLAYVRVLLTSPILIFTIVLLGLAWWLI
jgi:hypothetical protein